MSQNLDTLNNHSSFIWRIANILRGDYKEHEYGDVILPFTVLARLDSVLKKSKSEILKIKHNDDISDAEKLQQYKQALGGLDLWNISDFKTLEEVLYEPDRVYENLKAYIKGFSDDVQEVFKAYNFYAQIKRLHESKLLNIILQEFVKIDLSPEKVSQTEMGYIFEELIRRFSELSNETAGEHFTPREVIRLMVDLIFDDSVLAKMGQAGYTASLYDPGAGTGGMLSVATNRVQELNRDARLFVSGQELNPQTFAICKSDTMIKGSDHKRIFLGNSLTDDKNREQKFEFMLSNPPFGVEWKKYKESIQEESQTLGFKGRFGAGLPRVSDGALLFLQHMLSKMVPVEQGGSRIAVVFNGSPLFTGDAGSGESKIRKWILSEDLLEAIVALPDQLFYNTGIATYIWLLSNNKSPNRKGKVQLINGIDFFVRMRKALGQKRKEMTEENIHAIVDSYKKFEESKISKIFNNEDFMYNKVIVECPLRLNFAATPERIEKLQNEKPFRDLAKISALQTENSKGVKLQNGILEVLNGLGEKLYRDRRTFEKLLNESLKKANLSISAILKKSIMKALSEQDPDAEICKDSKGRILPDPSLRDSEQIPYNEDIYEYFAREVKPYSPDAWIDESKTQSGAEIPFTRYFYVYTEPDDPSIALAQIRALSQEIQSRIEKLFSEDQI